jgi:hypothetical protein
MKQVIAQLIDELNIEKKDLRIYRNVRGKIKRYSKRYTNRLISTYKALSVKQYDAVLTSIVLHDRRYKHTQFNSINENIHNIISKYDLSDTSKDFTRNVMPLNMNFPILDIADNTNDIINGVENTDIKWKGLKNKLAYYEVNLTLQIINEKGEIKKWTENIWTKIESATMYGAEAQIKDAIDERVKSLKGKKSVTGITALIVNGATMMIKSKRK